MNENDKQAEPVSDDESMWCNYIAWMICTYLNDDSKQKAIAGIIERRLWNFPREAQPVQPALSHVNETPKNEHDSDDVLNKSGNVDMMREALQECLEVFEAIPAIVPTHIELITQAIETGQKVQQALAAEPEPLVRLTDEQKQRDATRFEYLEQFTKCIKTPNGGLAWTIQLQKVLVGDTFGKAVDAAMEEKNK